MSTQRATSWSVTINFKEAKQSDIAQADEQIALARQRGWKVTGQPEVGQNGTLHYQLKVDTPQVRFSAVRKAFPRAHIEIARKPSALATYVAKEETRVGVLAESQDKYPSLSRLWELIYDEIAEEAIPPEWAPDEFYTLEAFDRYISRIILKGYHVESMAVNPQIRSCWSKFAQPILQRSVKGQTDRQTTLVREAEILSVNISTTRDGPQEDNSSPPHDAPPSRPRRTVRALLPQEV